MWKIGGDYFGEAVNLSAESIKAPAGDAGLPTEATLYEPKEIPFESVGVLTLRDPR